MKGFLLALTVGGLMIAAVGVPPAVAAPPASFGVDLQFGSRDIKEQGSSIGEVDGVLDTTSVTGRLGIGLVRGLSIFGEIGALDASVDEFDGYQSTFDLLYGGGIRLEVPVGGFVGYPSRTMFFSEFRARHASTSDQVTTLACVSSNPSDCNTPSGVFVSDIVDEHLKWWEYTIKIGANGRYENMRPFGGIELSKLDGTDSVTSTFSGLINENLDVREQNSIGFFLGTDILLDPRGQSAFTLEMSAIDQFALRAGFHVAF